MSYQHSSAFREPFPAQNSPQISQTHGIEARYRLVPTPQTQGISQLPIISAYTPAPDSATQHSPKTPPRTGTILSSSTPPSIDRIRALYRKYPDRFPRTPPGAGTTQPNAPRGAVLPKYRNTISNVSPSSPTPDRPRRRPSTVSHTGNVPSRRNVISNPTKDPGRKQPTAENTDDSELTLMYPDFGPGFIPAEDPAPSLALEIVSEPRDLEKWKSPQRDMYEGWNGTGWKLGLVISYISTSTSNHIDPDFEPSITVKNLTVECSLAAKPRPISGTTISARRPSESYRVMYHGCSTTFDSRGQLKPLQVDRGIHVDRHWRGPALALANKTGKSEMRVEYRADIYIPIPSFLFSAADTRAFDVEVRAWVSVGNRSAVQLEQSERLTLSQFGQVSGHNDSVGCALIGGTWGTK